MRIFVVGATGPLGRDVVDEALAQGHDVVALVRDTGRASLAPGVSVVQGDVLELETLSAALRTDDVVICALGTPSPRLPSTLLREGTQNLIKAMGKVGARRVVCVTLLGTGRSRRNASFFYREVILRVLAPMVPDKEAQERVLIESGLDWSVVRPPRFAGRRKHGNLRIIEEASRGRVGHVVRADLARFLLECGASDQYLRQALVVGS
jgi:uncharacterized protein YbjT (DUF2867 family)